MARPRSLLLVLAVLVSACGTAPEPDSSPGARAPSTEQPLAAAANPAILVSVTRIENPQKKRRKARRSAHWPLQDAKARFSELVRRATNEGPQHVTVHGRDQVVVIAADEYERLAGRRTGAELIAALQASPYPDIELEPQRLALPVREVKLT